MNFPKLKVCTYISCVCERVCTHLSYSQCIASYILFQNAILVVSHYNGAVSTYPKHKGVATCPLLDAKTSSLKDYPNILLDNARLFVKERKKVLSTVPLAGVNVFGP